MPGPVDGQERVGLSGLVRRIEVRFRAMIVRRSPVILRPSSGHPPGWAEDYPIETAVVSDRSCPFLANNVFFRSKLCCVMVASCQAADPFFKLPHSRELH